MTVAAKVRMGTALSEQLRVLLGGSTALRVVADSAQTSAVADLAVGPALLTRVGAGAPEAWFRLYQPVPTVGFSRRDVRDARYPRASAAARKLGFEPAVRAPGGRAVAYHRSTLCFDLVLPDGGADPVQRLAALGHVLVAVLVRLGVDARLGPVPDEYCPGRFSVNGGGTAKLVGTAGRRVRGALLLGGSIVVADPEPLRRVIAGVYAALGVHCDPGTVAATTDFGFDGTTATVASALLDVVGTATALQPAELPREILRVHTSPAP